MLLQAIAGELVSEYNHEKSLFLVCLSAFLYPWGIVSSLRSKAGRGRNTDITERPKGTSCEQSKHRLVEGVSTVGVGFSSEVLFTSSLEGNIKDPPPVIVQSTAYEVIHLAYSDFTSLLRFGESRKTCSTPWKPNRGGGRRRTHTADKAGEDQKATVLVCCFQLP